MIKRVLILFAIGSLFITGCSDKNSNLTSIESKVSSTVLSKEDQEYKKAIEESFGFELSHEQFLKIKTNEEEQNKKSAEEALKKKLHEESLDKELQEKIDQFMNYLKTGEYGEIFANKTYIINKIDFLVDALYTYEVKFDELIDYDDNTFTMIFSIFDEEDTSGRFTLNLIKRDNSYTDLNLNTIPIYANENITLYFEHPLNNESLSAITDEFKAFNFKS